MSDIKRLHIFPEEKFTEPYIEFINSNFNENDHFFLVIGKEENIKTMDGKNVKGFVLGFKEAFLLIKEMNKAKQIYLHSLLLSKLVLILFFQPWLLSKCYWIVWGGDLYSYRDPKNNFTLKTKEYMRAAIIEKFGHIITLVEKDYELVKEWYGAKGKYHKGEYLGVITKKQLDRLTFIKKEKAEPVLIQIGNSADPSNNHIEAFHKLKKFKEQNIRIITPLSYGDEQYAQQVIEEGRKIFKEKFLPLTEFLTPDEYTAFLNSIDIGIFNNDRQQALGNICVLLYLNKKIYIKSDTTMSKHFSDKYQIEVEATEGIENLEYEVFIKNDNNNNKEKIARAFEDAYIKDIWEKIFESA